MIAEGEVVDVAQIQWFPGHMARARREVEEKIQWVDIVFELLDARIPLSSANPVIKDIIKKKPRLILLNKADLADPQELDGWLKYIQGQGLNALAINSISGESHKKVLPETTRILADLAAKEAAKGMRPRPFRAMVLGIPNVGKSAFINRLAGKNIAHVGDRPGITKTQQYVRVADQLDLLDNPGILWPKFKDHQVGLKLSLIGAIKDEILPLEEVVAFGIRYLARHYPGAMEKRYGIPPVQPDRVEETWDAIGRSRGCLLPGNTIDYDRVMRLFLDDLRHLKLGQLSFESVSDHV
jgi:ribosome biogenesis GTPase A